MAALLERHLRAWLGAWPSPGGVLVVGSTARESPGWDGRVHAALAVQDPVGNAVLSVPPARVPAVRELTGALDSAAVTQRLPNLIGRPDQGWYSAVLRWTEQPAPLPDAGRWEPADGDGLPGWLRPFGGDVLVARDEHGVYLAGVGLKRHDPTGVELAVGTEPAARGRGLARRLVAQAARKVLDSGAVPTYIHDPRNTASAKAADGAGFPERGWRVFSAM
jgi:GNAT superfamily N-acetyltransferase